MRFMPKVNSSYKIMAATVWDSSKIVNKDGKDIDPDTKEAIEAADEIILHPAKDCLIGRSSKKDVWYAWGHVEGGKFVVTNFEPLLEKLAAAADEKFDPAFNEFLQYCQDLVDKHYKENFPSLAGVTLDASSGKRYMKIISRNKDSKHGSVYCFVDKTNGDILKAAGFNAPAKHARGNVYDKESWKTAVTEYGGAYLKR